MEKPRIVGGHVALDLVNTVAPRPADAEVIDWIGTPGALLHWARRVDLVTAAEAEVVSLAWAAAPAAAEQARLAVVEIREALYVVLSAALGLPSATGDRGAAPMVPREVGGDAVRREVGSNAAPREVGGYSLAVSLDRLMLRWSAATARSALRPGGPGEPPAVLEVGPPGALLMPDRLACAAVELARTADLAQLRACPVGEGGCGWLFLDRSRNHSRRWCTMDDCGTHAKSRRLTSRRRTARAVQG
jgi:predicted RNA-binding Zn ribbon-like protein